MAGSLDDVRMFGDDSRYESGFFRTIRLEFGGS